MAALTLQDRIQGCLVGSAIGAELGYAKLLRPDLFTAQTPAGIFDLPLHPVPDEGQHPKRVNVAKMTPFVDLGVRAYVSKSGRVMSEDFGALLRDDEGLAAPVFRWDLIHTTQELLKEGINPRIAALGSAPEGHICACMPAVGIYHFADPEYAYFDGVELGSVAQPRVGADWAGMCAAAISCAFDPSMRPEGIAETLLRLAHENSKDLYYELNGCLMRTGSELWSSEEWFLNWWYYDGARGQIPIDKRWFAYNPMGTLLPLLARYSGDARKLMSLLIAPPDRCMGNGAYVTAIIAGAIAGAMHGPDAFPAEWREWADPIASAWYPIADVVSARTERECEIIRETEQLAQPVEGEMSRLQDKVYGCILAGAIGNAAGSPVESQMYWEIDAKYPDGITTILEPRRLESEDDNQMAMLLVETYLRRKGLPVVARHFGETWKESLDRDHFYVLCMGRAYDLIREGWDPRITGHWSVVTGSTVMCMEPVGMYHLGDPEFAKIDATGVSYMYQRGLDVVAASILAASISEALRPDATVDSVCQAALDATPTEPFRSFDKREFTSPRDYISTCLDVAGKYDDVMAARPELYEKCLLYHLIDPLELLGLALAMFRTADGDIRQTIIGGTNIGRDADSIAGRGAAIAGALNGGREVPSDWVSLFRPEVLDKIRLNAARMSDVIIEKSDRLAKRRAV